MKIFVTGVAGFIGFHTCIGLVKQGHDVVGMDNINDYYETSLKYARLAELGITQESADSEHITESTCYSHFRFFKGDITDSSGLMELFRSEEFDMVCHLAAQAGVRYSLENPFAYAQANLIGFLSILEACRTFPVKHLVYASSSSVYGLNEKVPFSVKDNVDHPVSLYAATKKSNELMAHSYSHLYNIPVTGLRFFTVYGPWGRPDMSPMLFSRAISGGIPIKVFNNGDMERDFTYVGDIAMGIIKVLEHPAQGNPEWSGLHPDPSSARAPFRVYNIGNSRPVKLMDFISTLENALGKKAEKEFLPMQPGDVLRTWADVSDLETDVGYKPVTSLEEGIAEFALWFREYEGYKYRQEKNW